MIFQFNTCKTKREECGRLERAADHCNVLAYQHCDSDIQLRNSVSGCCLSEKWEQTIVECISSQTASNRNRDKACDNVSYIFPLPPARLRAVRLRIQHSGILHDSNKNRRCKKCCRCIDRITRMCFKARSLLLCIRIIDDQSDCKSDHKENMAGHD